MTAERPKAWMAWSSGKDSAWALEAARNGRNVDVVGMLTTVTGQYDRVSMHAVRNSLLDLQVEATGLPMRRAVIPAECTDEIYQAVMREAMEEALAAGVTHMVFGDLFLQDVRDYRVAQLEAVGMTAEFPLWGMDTAKLAREMISSGVKAVLTCVDPRKVPREFAGREYDLDLLAELPDGVDACGENGEFHTFVYDAPCFFAAIACAVGDVVERGGFVFADVLPR